MTTPQQRCVIKTPKTDIYSEAPQFEFGTILRTQPPTVLPSTSPCHHDLLSVTASLPAAEATTD